MVNALEIKNLSVQYNNTLALSGINLTIAENDFLAVIGPNGGGKSTLMKTILGIIKPLCGTIKLFDQTPEKSTSPIGYVPQFSGFNRNFPIKIIDVVLTGRLSGKSNLFHRYTDKDYEVVEKQMEKLGITYLKDRQIGQLSGGQLQKVLISRALATEPKLLLLDEPTASIDNDSKAQIYEFLKDVNQFITIILVTHDTAAISSYIKSIACLNKELHYHGEPKLDNSIIRKTFGCPVELIAHGVPHRVLESHGE
ncbi:MAG: ABC transporter ATP-binding protein [Clostridiaceae bacterium]|nr:ABC transporter ATP-binding protein [Clostridiaceae bacterium]